MVLNTLDIAVVSRDRRSFSIGHLCCENRVHSFEERVSECHDGALVSAASFQGGIARLQP
jgi:hypothetical protein